MYDLPAERRVRKSKEHKKFEYTKRKVEEDFKDETWNVFHKIKSNRKGMRS
jgi:hypothetical protein